MSESGRPSGGGRQNHDVVIAGAGPAGAQCARDLAARGYDVLVLETESEAEFPRQSNKSTGGTFPSMLSAFGIPDDVVMHFTEKVVLESPNAHFVRPEAGAVLNFAVFKRFLVDDGREKGAQYRFDARVNGPLFDSDSLAGVRYNGSEVAYGDIVVDATGPSAPLAKDLGVSQLERGNLAIGVEYELEGVRLRDGDHADLTDAMMLRLDHDVAPGGYSWIFHTGADTAKVGLCYIQNDSHDRYAQADTRIDDYLNRWLQTDPRFEDADRLDEHHRGSAHIQRPGQLSTDRFMAIGDAVPSVDPVWGEGIHKAMRSARYAATTADKCIIEGDASAANMATYDSLWHDHVAPRSTAKLLMAELIYLAPNERYDAFIRALNDADEDTLRKANDGSVRAIATFLKAGDVPLMLRFAKQVLSRRS